MSATLLLLGGGLALLMAAMKGRTYPLPPSYVGKPPAATFDEVGDVTGDRYEVRQWPPNDNDVVLVLAIKRGQPDFWIMYWHRREDGDRTLRELNVPDSNPTPEQTAEGMMGDFHVNPGGPQ